MIARIVTSSKWADLGVTTPPAIDFPVWMEYTRFLRGVAADAGVSMRTLDRALWQYSKVKQ
jgi:hypothetical protein